MKGFVLLVILLFFLIVFNSVCFAQSGSAAGTNSTTGTNVSNGAVKSVKYLSPGGEEKVMVYISNYTAYKTMRLTNPERIVVDILGASAPGKQQTINVNSGLILRIRYAQFQKGIARVVLDVKKQVDYNIEKRTDGLLISLLDQEKNSRGEVERGETEGTKAEEPKAEAPEAEEPEAETPEAEEPETHEPNTEGPKAGESEAEGSNTQTTETGNSKSEETEADKPGTEQPGKDEAGTGTGSAAEDGATQENDGTKQKIVLSKNFYIEYEYAKEENNIKVSLYPANYTKYNVMRLTGPDRIVIDITGSKLSVEAKEININCGIIKSVRYAQHNKNTVRVVLDTVGQPQYSISKEKDKLVLDLENSPYKNLTYSNNGDRIYFTLDRAKLTEGGEVLKKFYTEEYSSNGKKFTITFPRGLADIKDGLFMVNDGVIDSVEVVNDNSNNTTSMIFTAQQKFSYLVFTRPEVNNTTVTILKPAKKSEKLVVIDAGHGGKDPGATYGNVMEKDLNLDIALRISKLLEKKGVKTYMIREDDSYVGLYERAYLANMLNASIFFSVHNNAIGDPNYGGTMTLYHPQSSIGKSLAQIVQQKLVSRLGTRDRKIIERPNLVVLKATKMPSVLAEIAFITNSANRNNLLKASFRQEAAQALCEAIVQGLSKIK